jgi:hypothetical protein
VANYSRAEEDVNSHKTSYRKEEGTGHDKNVLEQTRIFIKGIVSQDGLSTETISL